MLFKSKKAVSPLIATVLLIAFAVALGAVVMNWGKNFVETTAKNTGDSSNLKLSCQQDVKLEVKEISGVPKICYNVSGQYLEVMLENNGRAAITGMQFVIFDTTDDLNITKNDSLTIVAGGVTNKIKVYHDLTGEISQVEFVPMIKPKGMATSQLCSENILREEQLSACS